MQSGFPCLSALFVLVISLHSLDGAVALDIGSKRSVPMSSSLEAFGGLKGLGIDLSGTGGTPGLDACMQAPTQEELLLQRLLQDDPGPCLAALALQGVDEAQRRVALAHRFLHEMFSWASDPAVRCRLGIEGWHVPKVPASLLWLNKGKVLKWWLSFATHVITASQQETRKNLVDAFNNISDHEKSKWRPIIEKICGNHLCSTLVPLQVCKARVDHI